MKVAFLWAGLYSLYGIKIAVWILLAASTIFPGMVVMYSSDWISREWEYKLVDVGKK